MLQQLGCRQSELDPCCFYWFHEKRLSGVLALHVDDLVMAGNEKFHDSVLSGLKKAYPFKHWKLRGAGMFLGRNLTQKPDGSIFIDLHEYINKVKTIEISKERRKELDQSLTEKELQQFRGVLGWWEALDQTSQLIRHFFNKESVGQRLQI